MIKFLKEYYSFINSSVNSSANVGRHIVLQNAVHASSPLGSQSVSPSSSPSSHSSKLIFAASPLYGFPAGWMTSSPHLSVHPPIAVHVRLQCPAVPLSGPSSQVSQVNSLDQEVQVLVYTSVCPSPHRCII